MNIQIPKGGYNKGHQMPSGNTTITAWRITRIILVIAFLCLVFITTLVIAIITNIAQGHKQSSASKHAEILEAIHDTISDIGN